MAVLDAPGVNPGDMQYWNGSQWVLVAAGDHEGGVLEYKSPADHQQFFYYQWKWYGQFCQRPYGLLPSMTYYVRSYATTSVGAYDLDKRFSQPGLLLPQILEISPQKLIRDFFAVLCSTDIYGPTTLVDCLRPYLYPKSHYHAPETTVGRT